MFALVSGSLVVAVRGAFSLAASIRTIGLASALSIAPMSHAPSALSEISAVLGLSAPAERLDVADDRLRGLYFDRATVFSTDVSPELRRALSNMDAMLWTTATDESVRTTTRDGKRWTPATVEQQDAPPDTVSFESSAMMALERRLQIQFEQPSPEERMKLGVRTRRLRPMY